MHSPAPPPPVLVEAWRGDMVESRHRGSIAIVDADGSTLTAQGDIDRPVYARSAIKPLQAIAFVETGAAEACAASAAEVAIACASHTGEPAHVATVTAWLARLGLSPGDLECGAHPPRHAPSLVALVRAGEEPSPVHNNCSGKHTAMLATCRHLGEPTRGYIASEHPAQRRIEAVLAAMTGAELAAAPRGIDGCGLPQIGVPLRALAQAIARFGAPERLASARAAACRKIAAAMLAEPFMLAGSGRFSTLATEICSGRALVKNGAEGVFVAAIPERGLGIALKIEDGAERAAEVAMAGLLARHAGLDGDGLAKLGRLLTPPIVNVAGRTVGRLAAATVPS